MKLTAQVGSLRNLLAAEVRAGERAATQTIRGETDGLKQALRRQAQAAFGANSRGIAFAWRSQTFPNAGLSLRPAGLVWSKVPAIIQGFDEGALIRPRGGKRFLAIPTAFNRQGGRRGGKPRVTPAAMVATERAFLRPFKSGRGFVWMLPVRQGGRVRGFDRRVLLGPGRLRFGTSKNRSALTNYDAIVQQRAIPMFLLLPAVKLPKKLDVARAAQEASRRIPRAFVAAWERESGRRA